MIDMIALSFVPVVVTIFEIWFFVSIVVWISVGMVTNWVLYYKIKEELTGKIRKKVEKELGKK